MIASLFGNEVNIMRHHETYHRPTVTRRHYEMMHDNSHFFTMVDGTTVTRVEYFPIMISGGSELTAHMPQHAQALRKQC